MYIGNRLWRSLLNRYNLIWGGPYCIKKGHAIHFQLLHVMSHHYVNSFANDCTHRKRRTSEVAAEAFVYFAAETITVRGGKTVRHTL
jgi:hypothetical protein